MSDDIIHISCYYIDTQHIYAYDIPDVPSDTKKDLNAYNYVEKRIAKFD